MLITACMIVKNEADCLDRCLSSVIHWADEVVLVDTGSTDDTIEIAKKYNARIFEQEWVGDFSHHRNYAFAQAQGDWLFVIDADEAVHTVDGPVMRKMLTDGIKEDIVSVRVLNVYEENRVGSRLNMVRFFRRSYKPEYAGKVHNKPLIRPGTKIFNTDFRLYHFGYGMSQEKMAEKQERRVTMCRQFTVDEPNNAAAWMHFVQALFIDSGEVRVECDELDNALLTGIQLCNGHNDEFGVYLQLLSHAAMLMYVRKDWKVSLSYSESILRQQPYHLDGLWLKGLNLMNLERLKDAEVVIKQYILHRELSQFQHARNTTLYPNEQARAYKLLAKIEERKVSSLTHYTEAQCSLPAENSDATTSS